MSGDAFSEAREELKQEWVDIMNVRQHTLRRITELEDDLEETARHFRRTKNWARRHAINKLRYLIIKEKNLLVNKGKDDWREY